MQTFTLIVQLFFLYMKVDCYFKSLWLSSRILYADIMFHVHISIMVVLIESI